MGNNKRREWRRRLRLLFASLSCPSVAEAERVRLDLQVEATSLEDACYLVWNNSETFMKEWQGKANTATSNPDDSHICKFMQIVVNLWAASIWKGESWGKGKKIAASWLTWLTCTMSHWQKSNTLPDWLWRNIETPLDFFFFFTSAVLQMCVFISGDTSSLAGDLSAGYLPV